MQHQERNIVRIVFGIVGALVLVSSVAYVQEPKTGKLKVSVSPSEAYVFVDQRAMGPGSRDIKLPPGKHNVIVANYGYEFVRRDVDIQSGETESIDAKLQPRGNDISGPQGQIQLEVGLWKAGDYAVLLNGKTPYYLVGHLDEFNNKIGPNQELSVPPGRYDVTVTRFGKVAWSGSVPVVANQRVIVDISSGKQKVKEWAGNETAQPRFKAGTASAAVNVAPVSGEISAIPGKIDCSQPSLVKWAARETIDNDITNMSPVEPTGEARVSPRQTTTYELTGVGPGGTVKTAATLEVNPVVVAQLETSPTELKYRRIGDKVLVQNSSMTLTWSTANADSVSISPIGTVESSGTRTVPVLPTRMTEGPLDETITYNLRATNVCGGTNAKTVAVHLTGSIEPIPEVFLNSVFFPTAYPDEKGPSVGLVGSQQERLATLAAGFTKYLEYDPDATLSLVGTADERGRSNANQALSERRVQLVKQFLIGHGISETKISTSAAGASQPLDVSTVEQLIASNPNEAPPTQVTRKNDTVHAYNRRVDIILLPKNQESPRVYPNSAPDQDILWQRSKPARNVVEQHSIATGPVEHDTASAAAVDTSVPRF